MRATSFGNTRGSGPNEKIRTSGASGEIEKERTEKARWIFRRIFNAPPGNRGESRGDPGTSRVIATRGGVTKFLSSRGSRFLLARVTSDAPAKWNSHFPLLSFALRETPSRNSGNTSRVKNYYAVLSVESVERGRRSRCIFFTNVFSFFFNC